MVLPSTVPLYHIVIVSGSNLKLTPQTLVKDSVSILMELRQVGFAATIIQKAVICPSSIFITLSSIKIYVRKQYYIGCYFSGCGADLSTPSGSFVSPNYPLRYVHQAECFWTITVSRGSAVLLVFADFDLEHHANCKYDYLEVNYS